MSSYFSVKCKRCGTVLETSLGAFTFDLEKIKGGDQIKCPRCHFIGSYQREEFFGAH